MGYVSELRSLIGHRPLVIAGAAVLIFDRHENLLLQLRRDNQHWGLIGGSMEVGESLLETARREAYEETGLVLDRLDWFDLFSGEEFIYQLPHGDIVVNVIAAYISQWSGREPKANLAEASEIRFFAKDKLPQNISPPDLPVIEKYFSSIQ